MVMITTTKEKSTNKVDALVMEQQFELILMEKLELQLRLNVPG